MKENKTDYTKTIRRIVLFVSVGLILHVLFLLFTVDKSSFALLKQISALNLLLICILAVSPWLGHTLRVMIWSRFINHPMKYRDLLPVIIVNDIGAALTPTALGGGPVKMAILIQKGMPASKATFLVLLSAVEDIIFYIVGIVLAAVYLKGEIINIVNFLASKEVLLITLAFFILFPFLFRKQAKKILKYFIDLLPVKYSEWLYKGYRKFKEYLSEIGSTFKLVLTKGKLTLLVSFIILCFQWLTKFSILALILISLDIDFTWFDMYIKQWLITVSMLMFPTPGASGGSEAAFLFIFKNEVQGDLANLIVSTWRFFTYYFTIIIAALTLNFFNKFLFRKVEVDKVG